MNERKYNVHPVTMLIAAICLGATNPALADITAAGTAEVTNIQQGLVDPNAGVIDWVFGDGTGGPAWQAEAWVHAADSLGGVDADYSATPDGAGMVSAFASTNLGQGSAGVDIMAAELSATTSAAFAPGQWANTAPQGSMFDFFSITPAGPGPGSPIEMSFSFDYQVHLIGQSEPGGSYFMDAGVGMTLLSLDGAGDWQVVETDPLFLTAAISGADGATDDLLLSGSLLATVMLDPDAIYSIEYRVYENFSETPTPGALALMLVASPLFTRRRRRD
jgi:hypothetical protein